MRQRGAGSVEQALDVDRDHAVPLLGVRTDDGAEEHQAGIVDEDVQPSESLNGPLYGRLGLGSVGDVRFHDQRGPARLVDLGPERFQTVPATGHERDGGTFLGEPAGGGGANAAACTGDKGRGAGQFRHHGVLSFLASSGACRQGVVVCERCRQVAVGFDLCKEVSSLLLGCRECVSAGDPPGDPARERPVVGHEPHERRAAEPGVGRPGRDLEQSGTGQDRPASWRVRTTKSTTSTRPFPTTGGTPVPGRQVSDFRGVATATAR